MLFIHLLKERTQGELSTLDMCFSFHFYGISKFCLKKKKKKKNELVEVHSKMSVGSDSKRLIFACLLSFISGILFSSHLLSSPKQQQTFQIDSIHVKDKDKPIIVNSTTIESISIQIQNCSLATLNLTLDKENIEQFYEEYYKYYELNKEW